MNFLGGKIEKRTASLLVIGFDVLAVLFFWISLMFMRVLVEWSKNDLSGDMKLPASAFTVQFEHQAKDNRVEDLFSIYWEWAEYILKEQKTVFTDPWTGQVDLNQNKVTNVYLGLDNQNFLAKCDRMHRCVQLKRKY
jgi:hypothetical protein